MIPTRVRLQGRRIPRPLHKQRGNTFVLRGYGHHRRAQPHPYHEEDAAVKYITWGGDQWVSYDDFDTFQQKIDFANGLGLGGLLIWAIDLDNKDLDALSAVVYPETGRHGTTGLWAQSNIENLWLTGPGYGAAGPF